MLENSNLIEGSKAKRVDILLKEYQDITTKLADLDTSKKLVLEELFKLAEIGTNETGTYVFNIVNNKGRETIGIKKLKENASDIYNMLTSLKLVNIGEDYKTVRGIKEKGQRS